LHNYDRFHQQSQVTIYKRRSIAEQMPALALLNGHLVDGLEHEAVVDVGDHVQVRPGAGADDVNAWDRFHEDYKKVIFQLFICVTS
jgi:hypothetical protein